MEFQSHSKHKNHFDVCLNKLVLERIQVISLSSFTLILTRMLNDACSHVLYFKKASIKFGEAFVWFVSHGKALPIDPDYSYLIRKGFIRLVT